MSLPRPVIVVSSSDILRNTMYRQIHNLVKNDNKLAGLVLLKLSSLQHKKFSMSQSSEPSVEKETFDVRAEFKKYFNNSYKMICQRN
jgi:hypothetical protein